MREHAENAPLTFKLEGSTVPGHEGKHSLHFTREFDSKCSQTNIESLTTEELIELHHEIERYIELVVSLSTDWDDSQWEWRGYAVWPPFVRVPKIEERINAQHQFEYEGPSRAQREAHPEWDACRRNAGERA